MTGKQLRRLRRDHGVTQEQLASAAGWKQPFIVQVESQAVVRPDTLSRYTDALKSAAARVSEERAAQRKVDQETLARLAPVVPSSTPAARLDSDPPTGPSALGTVPAATAPAPPVSPAPSIMKLRE